MPVCIHMCVYMMIVTHVVRIARPFKLLFMYRTLATLASMCENHFIEQEKLVVIKMEMKEGKSSFKIN